MVNCILFDDGNLALQSNGSNPIMTAPWWLLTQITGIEPTWGEKKLQDNVNSDLWSKGNVMASEGLAAFISLLSPWTVREQTLYPAQRSESSSYHTIGPPVEMLSYLNFAQLCKC